MKIRRLDLIAYGPFSNEVLDFQSDTLQIIYGPNEAGKSTALRALQAVLYGMTEKRDAFLHPWDLMRLRMSIEAGKELIRVERRKGKGARSLVYADTERPVSGEEWKRIIPVLDEHLFMQMFALDYRRLVEGGRELAEGKGDIGQALLAAAGDLGNAVERLGEFRNRATELFQPNARSQSRLAVALREYKDADRRIRSEKFGSHAYRTAVAELEEKRRQIERLAEETRKCASQHSSMTRLRQAAPGVALLLEKQRALDAMSNVPTLPLDFGSRHREAVNIIDKASTAAENSEANLKRLRQKLTDTNLNPVLAGLKLEIERLLAQSGKIEAARQDRPKREGELRTLRERVIRNLADIGLDLEPSRGTELRVKIVQRNEIKRLAEDHPKLTTRIGEAVATIERLKGAVTENKLQLQRLPAGMDTSELDRCLSGLSDAPTERELAKTRAQVVSAEVQAEAALKALPLFHGTAAQLETIQQPLPATIRSFQIRFAELEAAERHHDAEEGQAKADIAGLQEKIRQLENRGTVPTVTDLQGRRDRRELGWSAVKYRWLEGRVEPAVEAQFLSGSVSDQQLATAYEESVADADSVADRMRCDAASVEKKVLYLDQIARGIEKLNQARQARENAANSQQTLDDEWTALWQPSSIKPRSPIEMLDWVDARREVVDQWQRASGFRRELTGSEGQFENWRAALAAALLALREPTEGSVEGLALRARDIVQASSNLHTKKRDLENEERRLGGEQVRAERHQCDLEAQLADWKRKWAEAVKGLPIPAGAQPEAAQEVVRLLDDISTDAEQIYKLVHRIDTMERNEREFSADVGNIAARAGVVPGSSDALVVISKLNQEATAAKRNEDAAALLQQDIERSNELLRNAELEIERQRRILATLCSEASVSDSESLGAAIENAVRKRDLENQIAEQTKALAGACAGRSVQELVEAVTALDLDTVPGQLKDLEDRQQQNEDLRQQHARRVLELEREFEVHESAAALSQAAAEKQDAEARIWDYAEQYLEHEIAARLLSAAMERYRTRHQDPLLERAGEYLRNLTCGSFSKLVVDFEDGNRRILRAVRHGTGQHVDVTGMSDGARDQLFFALRLAYIEDHCTRIGRCPVILDDVLMAFDNERAAAALRVLAMLAKRTQVLLFTHHLHHGELARRALERDTFTVHELTVRDAVPA
jgi:uncharacterized protein YhaN